MANIQRAREQRGKKLRKGMRRGAFERASSRKKRQVIGLGRKAAVFDKKWTETGNRGIVEEIGTKLGGNIHGKVA